MTPSTKVSADYLAAMERIRGMILARQGTAGVAGGAQDITRTYGVSRRVAGRMLERPETLSLRELAILMTWLGHRIQFKAVTEPPPLAGSEPPVKPRPAKKAVTMDLETWKAWVEENRRKEAARGSYGAR